MQFPACVLPRPTRSVLIHPIHERLPLAAVSGRSHPQEALSGQRSRLLLSIASQSREQKGRNLRYVWKEQKAEGGWRGQRVPKQSQLRLADRCFEWNMPLFPYICFSVLGHTVPIRLSRFELLFRRWLPAPQTVHLCRVLQLRGTHFQQKRLSNWRLANGGFST